jgi:hypothetical protein
MTDTKTATDDLATRFRKACAPRSSDWASKPFDVRMKEFETSFLTFNGREEYLGWVATWKSALNEIVTAHTKRKRDHCASYWDAHTITSLILIRRAAKQESKRQYETTKEADLQTC